MNEPGITRKDVQQKFNLSESTLKGFIKSKNKLFESFEDEIDETKEELDVEPPLVDLLNSLTNLRKSAKFCIGSQLTSYNRETNF